MRNGNIFATYYAVGKIVLNWKKGRNLMRTKLHSLIATAALLPIGTIVYAQGRPSQQPMGQETRQTGRYGKSSKTNTLTGCLTQGTSGDFFRLKTKGSQGEVLVQGSSDLAEYVNQMVQLKGNMSQENGRSVFKVTKFKRIGRSCTENSSNTPRRQQSPTRRQQNPNPPMR